jgi:type 1 glutamine amidotransferase
MITTANLAKFAGVVMVNNGAQPFGNPGTAQTQALVAFVRGGGGLAAFHATSVTGDSGAIGMLLGGTRTDPGGDFRTTDCFPEAGSHPTVAKLAMPYRVMNEEYYTFSNLNASNQVVLRCSAANGNDRLPITWVREEGAGRVFFTGLGHYAAFWTGGRFLGDHAWPGVLWTIKK